jgi:hypothetical protein
MSERIDGWAADTSKPLGSLPLVFAAIAAAVLAAVMTNTVASAVGWLIFSACTFTMLMRGARWAYRELDAVSVERETTQMLDRDPGIVPLSRLARSTYDAQHYDKAS